VLRDLAFETLTGFGDAAHGEWIENRPKAFHLRRRLTAVEQEQIGDAVDCRGTDEALARFAAMKDVFNYPSFVYFALSEIQPTTSS
jgi:hypothetical protein